MKRLTLLIALVALALPSPILAANRIGDDLFLFYNQRADLQAAFDRETYKAIPGTGAGFLIDLEDWAEQYGWREHPELAAYGPSGTRPVPSRPGIEPDRDMLSAHAYLVMDRSTGLILAASRADQEWPIASLTKLVTADVVLDAGVSGATAQAVLDVDDVGGAKLYVEDGERFSVDDLFYATLVGSANNAANALSRSTGFTREGFVRAMNARALELNLAHTRFVDPTGIELGNVSSAREIARLAEDVLESRDLRRYASTASRVIYAMDAGEEKTMTSTNWMLWKPEYDDLYVTSGKTGYLIESRWNLMVTLRPDADDADRELMIVVFGAGSRGESFIDARYLAE
jgi:D-alanyl-D-alanine endopeptidase (penicillin-binding protein 7)